MWIGINHHPLHENITPQEIQRFDVVRYPVWTDVDKVKVYQRFTKEVQGYDGRPLIVCDKRSLGPDPNKAGFRRLLRRYPTVEYWQIGNESDQPNSDSSWYMKPDVYRQLLEDAVEVLQGKTLLSTGFVSGDVNYLRQLSYFPFDKLCIHPYGIYPWRRNPKWHGEGFGDIIDTIKRYQDVCNKTVWITEFGIPLSAFNNRQDRQLYYEDMLNAMSDYGVEAALPYCWSDCQCNELALKGEVNI